MRVLAILAAALLASAACGDDEAAEEQGAGGGGGGGQGGQGGTVDPGLEDIAWRLDRALPIAVDHHVTWAAESPAGTFLYAGAGVTRAAGQEFRDEIYYAKIAEDGSVGAWTETASLPQGQAGAAMGVLGRTVVLAGGITAGAIGDAVSVGRIGDDGAIESWSAGPALPEPRFHAFGVASGDWFYVLGGLDTTGWATNSIYRTRLQQGALAQWEAVGTLPEKLSHQAAAVHDGWLYSAGGLAGNPFNGNDQVHGKVWRARLGDDGSLGAFEALGPLPETRAVHAMAVARGHLVISGGNAGGPQQSDTVIAAEILPDGLGPWTSLTSLPFPRAHTHHTPVVGDRIYSLGGQQQEKSTDALVVGTLK